MDFKDIYYNQNPDKQPGGNISDVLQRRSASPPPAFRLWLQGLILLSPLPFGSVGKIFSPFFYLLLAVTCLVGLNRWGEGGRLSDFKSDFKFDLRWVRRIFYLFLGVVFFQLVPLPFVLLELVSPEAAGILTTLKSPVPAFHPLSLSPHDTLVSGVQVALWGFFFFILLRVRLEASEVTVLLNTMLFSAVFQVVFAFLKYVAGNRYFFLFFMENRVDPGRVSGTLGNANHFAAFLEMILPVAAALWLRNLVSGRRRGKQTGRILYPAAVVASCTGIFLSGSRGGVLIMVLLMCFFLWFAFSRGYLQRVKRQFKALVIAILVIGVLFGLHTTVQRFMKTRLDQETRIVKRWPSVIGMVADFPFFGTGLGTFRYAYYLYDKEGGTHWTIHAHNEYLEILTDGGLIGGGLFLVLAVLVLFPPLKVPLRKGRGQPLQWSLKLSICAVLLHSVFDFPLRIPSNALVFVLLVVLATKMSQNDSPRFQAGAKGSFSRGSRGGGFSKKPPLAAGGKK